MGGYFLYFQHLSITLSRVDILGGCENRKFGTWKSRDFGDHSEVGEPNKSKTKDWGRNGEIQSDYFGRGGGRNTFAEMANALSGSSGAKIHIANLEMLKCCFVCAAKW